MPQQFPCPPALTPCSVGQAAAAVIGYNDQRVVSLDAAGCMQSGVAPPSGGSQTAIQIINLLTASGLLVDVQDTFGVHQYLAFP